MGIISDLVNGEFAHLDPAAQVAAIDRAAADMAAMPDADRIRIQAAIGVDTDNKRNGAEAVAVIRAFASVAAQVGLKLF